MISRYRVLLFFVFAALIFSVRLLVRKDEFCDLKRQPEALSPAGEWSFSDHAADDALNQKVSALFSEFDKKISEENAAMNEEEYRVSLAARLKADVTKTFLYNTKQPDPGFHGVVDLEQD